MMNRFLLGWLASIALLVTTPVMAQDEEAEVVYGWTGVGEFGLVRTTGNTESEAVNMRLEFVKLTETWRHRFTATALTTSEDGIQDNERYNIEVQSHRKLSEKSYIFGAFRWDADRFGAYDPQATLTAGYGRELMKSERHVLKSEIGAGYRSLEERVTGISSEEAIVRFLLDDAWAITDNTNWTNRLLIETGSDNTFSQFNTGLTVAMTDKFAIKVGYEIRNNSKVPPGDSEKTDTVLTTNLVYNF
jgi:putative salt-induced outer membrane protein